MAMGALLQQRIQRFRFGAYAWLAVELLLLSRDAAPQWMLWSATVAAFAMPTLFARVERVRTGAAQPIENVATPCLIALLGLPLLPTAAVIGALLTGTVAQLGWRSLPMSLLGVAAGYCSGLLFAPHISYGSAVLADALCVIFIGVYTTRLCALGYEQTMRLHRQREHIAAGSVALAQQRDMLARYVAPSIAARANSAAPQQAAIRRCWLTVAFVDITEFTAMTQRLEPEDLTALLNDFFAALVELTQAHGGNLHKFLGDGALISFGEMASAGRRADAAACVTMLGEMAPLVESLNAAARSRGVALSLRVRCGVASGYCSVGDFGAGTRLEYTMIGAPVNLASRLEAMARPGETWVSETTRNLVGEDAFEALGAVIVKGVSAPVAAFRLQTNVGGSE